METPYEKLSNEDGYSYVRPAGTPSAAITEMTVAPEMQAVSRKQQDLPAPKRLNHLLVPLDGTREGEWALPYATALARMLHAQLVLGHVTPTETVNPIAQALHIAGSREQVAQQTFAPQALSYLRDLRWRLAVPMNQMRTFHISAPTVTDGLLDFISTNEIDLVFLRLRTHYTAGNLSLGTVVDALIRQSPVPVLVIPPAAEPSIHPFTLRHIMLPLDGSALAESALAPLLGLLTQAYGQPGTPLTVTLFGVAENYAVLPDYQSYLHAIRARLLALPICAHIQINAIATVGSAPGAIVTAVAQGIKGEESEDGKSDTISAFASAGPVDLVLMATHGRGGLDRWLFGSVASYVLPRIEIPVLLTHPVFAP
jgi:nucleotide-binding universal stress UspA family protein